MTHERSDAIFYIYYNYIYCGPCVRRQLHPEVLQAHMFFKERMQARSSPSACTAQQAYALPCSAQNAVLAQRWASMRIAAGLVCVRHSGAGLPLLAPLLLEL